MNFAPWQGAVRCTGGATPGGRALMAWLNENYRPPGKNWGIYVCRKIARSKSYSVHSEGRALDWWMPMVNRRGTAAGEAIVRRLGAKGRSLGIQCIIYNRKIYDARSPYGRYYGGVHPHYDHLHIELTRTAGSRLTLATCRSLLGGKTPAPAPKPAPKPTPTPSPTNWEAKLVATLPLVSTTSNNRGTHARRAQSLLAAAGYPPRSTFSRDGTPDGIFGSNSDTATRQFQRARKLTADGKIGKNTWSALLGG